ncbi:serine carboxypeptidase-like 48 [Rhodamnia argentea]|uniref:Serine carboxypeptidase-like 48 n=1 Tax=Rhodamnia argentea TaxID=178133 RepID=A0ABM3HUP3_9MYRT|nr:serine carboxypeptidase-like 48 [Rhodamnia argentea]
MVVGVVEYIGRFMVHWRDIVLPAFADRVHQGHKAKEGIHINLKGFAIGNGLTDLQIQYGAYADYALNMGLITQSDHDSIDTLFPKCKQVVQQWLPTKGGDTCGFTFPPCIGIFSKIKHNTGKINSCEEGHWCSDFLNMETFLNQKTVRDALGVGDIELVTCSRAVYEAIFQDWMKNLEAGIPAHLEDGLKVLIYAGEYDLICNWLGNSNCVHAMEWSGQNQFGTSPTVHDAGHMVPMDQPKAALHMIKSWMADKCRHGGADKADPQMLKSLMAGKVAVACADSEIAT